MGEQTDKPDDSKTQTLSNSAQEDLLLLSKDQQFGEVISKEQLKAYKEKTADFHLLEYQSLRAEIATLSEGMHKAEIYCVLAAGTIFTWLATNMDKPWPKIVWAAPFVFSVLGALNSYGNYRGIIRISKYLQVMESRFCNEGLNGWETHVNGCYPDGTKVSEDIIDNYKRLFWTILIIFSIVVPLAVLKIRP